MRNQLNDLTYKDMQEFGDWAFDDARGLQSLTENVRKWNELHGHLIILDDVFHLCNDIELLIRFWQESKNV